MSFNSWIIKFSCLLFFSWSQNLLWVFTHYSFLLYTAPDLDRYFRRLLHRPPMVRRYYSVLISSSNFSTYGYKRSWTNLSLDSWRSLQVLPTLWGLHTSPYNLRLTPNLSFSRAKHLWWVEPNFLTTPSFVVRYIIYIVSYLLLANYNI